MRNVGPLGCQGMTTKFPFWCDDVWCYWVSFSSAWYFLPTCHCMKTSLQVSPVPDSSVFCLCFHLSLTTRKAHCKDTMLAFPNSSHGNGPASSMCCNVIKTPNDSQSFPLHFKEISLNFASHLLRCSGRTRSDHSWGPTWIRLKGVLIKKGNYSHLDFCPNCWMYRCSRCSHLHCASDARRPWSIPSWPVPTRLLHYLHRSGSRVWGLEMIFHEFSWWVMSVSPLCLS